MKILITGASGLVGSALVPHLASAGHQVTRLVRGASSGPGEIAWDPGPGRLDASGLEGLDAVVHLAGENIATGRWTARKKARIRDSRVQGTRLLCETLAGLSRPPQVIVAASAIGFYGDRGAEILVETSAPGHGFLAEVCREWEGATAPARERGLRVAFLRTGIVLTRAGGALARMLTPFRLGVGGRLGDGSQFMSWITRQDLVGVVARVIGDDTLQGPVNAVSPKPVTNLEFTRALGKVLRRPTLFPLPAFVARAAFGEMADALLLSSTRVRPARLLSAGFRFQHPEIESALRSLLGRNP